MLTSLIYKSCFRYLHTVHPTLARINKLSDTQILNSSIVKQVIQKVIPKRTITSQFSLTHGVQPKSGNQTCFSEKKSRRSWAINIQKKKYYSQVLDRVLSLRVSTRAIRCIRKAGNIDNYIMMTKPERLDSMYGEYLRRLMLLKVNNPDFRVPKILREKSEFRRIVTRQDKLPNPIWIPPEIRHTDFSQKIKQTEDDLNPRELRKVRQMEELINKFEDIETNHPLLKEFQAKDQEFQKWAKFEGEKALNKFKAKKNKEKIRRTLEELENEDLEEQVSKATEQKQKKK